MARAMKKYFAIGDIHGCLDKLLALMDLLDVDWGQDTVVFMGDYIDRGPDSKGVVDLRARTAQTSRPRRLSGGKP